ncbi:MAG: glycosyl hydrolase [Crocinitomicaceae bacterium]|nr:glycosyl hydrolase [Crocinitomicaceae bacterium]MCF8433471.1 glycosyl hydrolase [Crocinitomicaceae bacterium]
MKLFFAFFLSSITFFSSSQSITVYPNDTLLPENSRFRQIGPFRGGRSAAVCGDLKNKNLFYMGTTGGGVWKTIDGGSNWKNISDGYFGGSIGAVSVAPSDPTILYVGEGENTVRGNVSEGFGMWKSEDAGRTWKNIGLKDSRHIVRIVIHPKDPNIVWVAALGHLFGPSQERGIYKTVDGGKTWKRVLFSDELSGAADLVMEPGNPQVLYASTWSVIRTPHSLESGGPGSALWKSKDGGETWQKLNKKPGFPSKSVIGIIGVAVSASNPDKVYAIVENSDGGLFTSEDGGENWKLTNSENKIRQRAWYYSKVFVDPLNENNVFILNVDFEKSTDGGKTFHSINTPHGDHHDLWLDPEQPSRMIVADDGGAQISFDGGANWSTYQNQPTAQIYRISTDNNIPYRILGAQQDNSTIRILSRSERGEINQSDWTSTAGFESGYVIADPMNPDIVYGGNYAGFLSRLDHKTGENRAISVWPDLPIGTGADAHKYRFQWNFPIFFSPHNPKRLYAAGNMLFVSEDEGASWKTISPDLTTNDKSKQVSSGGPITKDNTTVEFYCTIFTAAESQLEKDVLWVGSDDGLIQISKDGGANWTNVTPPAAGKLMMWNSVELDPLQKGKAYFVGTKYKLDDFKPYIFLTEDYGKSWKLITKGIDSKHFARVLRVDPKRKGLLYCGTEYGFYMSYDDGANWKKVQLNLPQTPITDMCVKDNALVIATQGRSIWVMDDLAPLQSFNVNQLNDKMYMYPISNTLLIDGWQNKSPKNAGMNPPNGVIIPFHLTNFNDTVNVEIIIRDSAKKLITAYSSKSSDEKLKLSAKDGMNLFTWDMNYQSIEPIAGMILWNGTIYGPTAAPGNYTATLKINGDSLEKPFLISANPKYNCSNEDYALKTAFLLEVKKSFADVQKCIVDIRTLRSQINEFNSLAGKDVPKEIKSLSDTIQKKLTKIEEELYQTKLKSGQDILNYPMKLNDRISGLYNYASSGNTAPNKQVKDAFLELKTLADEQLKLFQSVIEKDVVELNMKIKRSDLPVIGIVKNK